MADINARFQLRKGTASLWASVNPILADGEPGFETDTGRLRIGNGSTAFISLPYFSIMDASTFIGATTTLYTGNLNSLTGKTVVPLGTGVSNGWPGAAPGDFVMHFTTDASNASQIGFAGNTGGQTWRRTKVAGTWGAWKAMILTSTAFGESLLAAADAAAGRSLVAAYGAPDLATASDIAAGTAGKLVDASLFRSERRKYSATQATTSRTFFEFTFPTWAKLLKLMFFANSTNGTDAIQVRAGAGTVEATGYVSLAQAFNSGSTAVPSAQSSTVGFNLIASPATAVLHGVMTLERLENTNTWLETHVAHGVNGATFYAMSGSGSKTFGGAIDRIRVTTTGGTNTFDAGTLCLAWE